MKTQRQKKAEVEVEKLDDIPLLVALQQEIGLAEIIDRVIPRHWLHQGLSLGQLIVGWTSYIVSEADHRKVPVEDWAVEHQQILSDLLSTPLRRTDFTDDRLGQVLSHLAKDSAWHEIETQIWNRSVSVYRLTPERVRLDATRFSGYHTPTDDGLMQHGYNSDSQNLAQVKLMAASIDCSTSGHLLATDVVSGSNADDPLYLPMIQRIRETFLEPGLLYLGDSKMSALEIRAELAMNNDFYLVPLAKVGDVPKHYTQWVGDIVNGSQPATLIYNTNNEGVQTELIAAGYQTTRPQKTTQPSGEEYVWTERILVIRSLDQAKRELAKLQRNIESATKSLKTLTPEPGRGRRPIRTQAELIQKALAILESHNVSDYLRYTYRREVSVRTQYIGPGRGGANRKRRKIRTVRYQITEITVDDAAIKAAFCQMGWKLYATNQPQKELALDEAVRLYRAAPRIERHFHLFKSAPISICPMYVRNDDQIKGLTRLLSLCVRLLTLIEIVTRRHLSEHQTTLVGLYEGNPKRETNHPTATRLLRVFRGISRVRLNIRNKDSPYTTPLTSLQRKILAILGISESVYQTPKHQSSTLVALGRFTGRVLAQLSVTVNRVLNPS